MRPLRIGEGLSVLGYFAVMAIFLLGPLSVLLGQAVTTVDGAFTFDVLSRFFRAPGLRAAVLNTALLGAAVAGIVLPLAFALAYAVERTRLPCRGVLAAVASAPLLVPSLLPALALVYLFGRQGLLTPFLGGKTIYGWTGLLVADAFAAFPHALILLRTALSAADGRLYEQASLLGAGPWRTFWRVTLPGARHGLVSAGVVVFSLTIADVGAPKVVGGGLNVVALEIYKAVLGRQDFPLGAAGALLLLAPSLIAVTIERLAARRQAALVSSRSTPYAPPVDPGRDWALGLICVALVTVIVGLLGVCQWAAVVRLWPYDLSFSLLQYDFDRFDGGGWSSVADSLLLGLSASAVGVAAAFSGAYVAERTQAAGPLRALVSVFALAPAATPGLALGLAYILYFNDPGNPLHVIYGAFAILVAVTVTHYYTVAHLTCVSALKALDPEFEAAGRALGRSRVILILKVIAPLCAPALIEVAVYLFIAATTTVSAVVFLYPPDVKLAAVAVLNMDDAGDSAPAAAMGTLILYMNLLARIAGQGGRALLARSTTAPERGRLEARSSGPPTVAPVSIKASLSSSRNSPRLRD